jgi:hypothetical protein
MRLHILDLDGSLPNQAPIARRLSERRARRHDLRAEGPGLRLWATRSTFDAFSTYWRGQAAERRPSVAFVGSGDFHHLTPCFLEAVTEPVTVIHFDNHPDWCRTLPPRHCGSWVNHALALPQVVRVVTIGPCSDDLDRPDRRGANLKGLSDGRHELFAWHRPPSRIGRTLNSGHGHVAEPGVIRWLNLDEAHWPDFLDDLSKRIPTRAIWLTIDKDVLPEAEAATNWDQGGLPLSHLTLAIRTLAGRFVVAGADVCGDYSPVRHRNVFKWIEARLDQPRRSDEGAHERNAVANETLLSVLEDVL